VQQKTTKVYKEENMSSGPCLMDYHCIMQPINKEKKCKPFVRH